MFSSNFLRNSFAFFLVFFGCKRTKKPAPPRQKGDTVLKNVSLLLAVIKIVQMKKIVFFFISLASCYFVMAQNVGIGTKKPRFPLNFSSALGEKISLSDDGNAGFNNFGIGVQSGLLQIHSDSVNHDIVFGFGSTDNLTERFRFKGNGNLGIGVANPDRTIDVKGRIRLRNAGGGGAVVLFSDSLNSAIQAVLGLQNDSTIGLTAYTSTYNGYGISMNTYTGNVGIKYGTPKVPLSFEPSLGPKISLRPAADGSMGAGFGVDGNRLQIYTDDPNGRVAFGYQQNSSIDNGTRGFLERFAVAANGALLLMNNAGTAGQFLTSNGPSNAAGWGAKKRNSPIKLINTETITIDANDKTDYRIPGLVVANTGNNMINLPSGSYMVDIGVEVESVTCFSCPPSEISVSILDNSYSGDSYYHYYIKNGERKFIKARKIVSATNPSPANAIYVHIQLIKGPQIRAGSTDANASPNYMIYEKLN